MNLRLAQELLNIDEDLRHYNRYRGVFFRVFDMKRCVQVRLLSLSGASRLMNPRQYSEQMTLSMLII